MNIILTKEFWNSSHMNSYNAELYKIGKYRLGYSFTNFSNSHNRYIGYSKILTNNHICHNLCFYIFNISFHYYQKYI